MVTLGVVIAGCGQAEEIPAPGHWNLEKPAIDGRRFIVTELVVAGESIDVSSGPPTFLLTAGHVSGTTGCNAYDALGIADSLGALELDDIASTKMFCPDTADIEAAFTDALGSIDRWELNGETLVLTDLETDTEIVLVDAGPAPIN